MLKLIVILTATSFLTACASTTGTNIVRTKPTDSTLQCEQIQKEYADLEVQLAENTKFDGVRNTMRYIPIVGLLALGKDSSAKYQIEDRMRELASLGKNKRC